MTDYTSYKKACIADKFSKGQTIHSLSYELKISAVDIEKVLMDGMKSAHRLLEIMNKAGILDEIIKASDGGVEK